MKIITLDDVIQKHLAENKDFAEHYSKELLINAVSKMIISLRKSAHLTQAELAKKVGTTQPVIARLESGSDTRVPSLYLLSRIAEASHARLNIGFELRK